MGSGSALGSVQEAPGVHTLITLDVVTPQLIIQGWHNIHWRVDRPRRREITASLHREGPLRFPPKFERAIIPQAPKLYLIPIQMQQHRTACQLYDRVLLIRERDQSYFRPGLKPQKTVPWRNSISRMSVYVSFTLELS